MKRNAMGKNLRQSIWKSLGRYLAIVAIIALGASMFVGLLMTKSDMVATGQKYMDEQNMFDLRLVSAYGWDPEDVEQIRMLDGVADAEGLVYVDMVARMDHAAEDSVYRFCAIPQRINLLVLTGGRMPENDSECLIDGYHMTDSILGTRITVSKDNEEASLDALKQKTLTIVGYVSSPLYMDLNRGTTNLGNGSLNNILYVLPDALELDYYPEIHVTIPGDYTIYTERYNQAMEAAVDALESHVQPIAQERMVRYREEARRSYEDGLAEYEDGLRQFEEGKAEALKELEEAEKKLQDGEKQLAASEQQLKAAEMELAEGRKTFEEGEKQYQDGLAQLEAMKQSLYGPVNASIADIEKRHAAAVGERETAQNQLDELDAQIEAISQQIAEEDALIAELDRQIGDLDSQISAINRSIAATEATLAWAKLFPATNEELIASLEAELAQLYTRQQTLLSQRDALIAQREPIVESVAGPFEERQAMLDSRQAVQSEWDRANMSVLTLENRLEDLQNTKTYLDEQFADTEAQLKAAEEELEAGRKQLEEAQQQIWAGWAALEQGKKELEDGWAEYEQGKQDAEQELAEAEAELADAKKKLDEAKEIIDSMTVAKVFLLDRTSNIGYNSLNSSSDIVSGVSRVFPAFFLLVAALVCITTMTRMIDEERTQIGTLKALGYSNGAIISKYLIYAGSGAVLGCGFGVIVGSVAFPMILWEAYKIMLHIPGGIALRFNWGLIVLVVGAYTAVMLLVTWYCCRRTLREQPAELIRPKSPDAGKKILLEYLPVWRRISFLNKVTIRNIFRYRQRLAMMMVGIGGCTALLLTGFGLRDSIVNVVDYQFQEVTTYDMTVYFSDGQTVEEQEDFISDVEDSSGNAMFYHQSSIDLAYAGQVKEIYLIAAESGVRDYIDLHRGEEMLPMPGCNEVLLSVGVSEALGISVGDVITLRNADMQVLELTVSGIYDNHVYNYAIIIPETIEAQWGEMPEMQMAFVSAREGESCDNLAAEIGTMSDVMNVSISEDLADMVGSMMDALDLVVIVIVICAGAMAVIVLYNLTNININERIREIATIKVLGFNAKETAMYVFKENLSLTVIGSVVGLGLGYLLLLFVMSQIKIDMVWFKALAMPISYVLAVVLTILSAILVDFVFYFKLDKINMAEALKSVE